MTQAGTFATNNDLWHKGDGKGLVLIVWMAFVVGGVLPLISYYSRPLPWVGWGLSVLIVFLYSRKLSLKSLFMPVMPYFLWLLCFTAFGLIVAPASDLSDGAKSLLTTLLIAAAMAIITSETRYLRYFSNAIQLSILFNLLLIPLALVSSRVNNLIASITLNKEAYEAGASRFGGLWGNPNMAGYICLVAIILSTWATPIMAWIGRISAVQIIYLSASRKCMLLLLLIITLNLIIVQRHNLKNMFLYSVLAVSGLSLFVLSDGLLQTTQTRMANNRTITRLMDVTESDTAQAGGETRMDLLQHWLPIVSAAPWYGYGYGAMAGGADATGKVVRTHLFPMGTHNTYLGILIETGPIGLISFLLVLIYYARNYFMFRGTNTVRWSLLSFLACNVIILIVSHSHLFSFDGKTAFALFFLLPTSPALMRQALAS